MIDINCDVGEGVNNEHLLMPYITSCNIACGGHAGDEKMMTKVVELAKKHQVKIGAHPSYPDKENFGRKSILLSAKELNKTINHQIKALEKVASEFDMQLHHIKPHGALYNDIAKDNSLAKIFLDAIHKHLEKYVLYVPYESQIEKEALRNNFKIIYEAFADRNYNDDLNLVSRKESNAILTDVNQIIEHISLIKEKGEVRTISGQHLEIKASTFCVHSDTNNSVEIVKKIHEKFI
ncbi:MAG: 5-oxoprolinase subunit PxpA [Cyclobacteriaceae bacterium]|nr:5-oxoprolinase subunit PxpA [Cyclobacteriaceae bacterium]